MEEFKKLKAEILKRAKKANACTDEYKKAYASETASDLIQVIKDNFNWCCNNQIIDADLIGNYEDIFGANEIWLNRNISSGFAIAFDNATVKASGNATVEAWGNATVKAWGNATVEAWGNATVRASGNATVEAWDNATVRAFDNAIVEASGNATVRASGNAYIYCSSSIECKISDKAIIRRFDINTIQFCSDDLKFEKVTVSDK